MSPTVELGRLPPEELLPILLPISSSAGPPSSGAEMTLVDTRSAVGSLMSLLVPQSELEAAKLPKVWVGDGLPSIPRKTYDKILWWEFVDMVELQPVGVLDKLSLEPDPHRFVILPGLEVTQARKKPIRDLLTWIQCFNIYITVVAKKHPMPHYWSHFVPPNFVGLT